MTFESSPIIHPMAKAVDDLELARSLYLQEIKKITEVDQATVLRDYNKSVANIILETSEALEMKRKTVAKALENRVDLIRLFEEFTSQKEVAFTEAQANAGLEVLNSSSAELLDDSQIVPPTGNIKEIKTQEFTTATDAPLSTTSSVHSRSDSKNSLKDDSDNEDFSADAVGGGGVPAVLSNSSSLTDILVDETDQNAGTKEQVASSSLPTSEIAGLQRNEAESRALLIRGAFESALESTQSQERSVIGVPTAVAEAQVESSSRALNSKLIDPIKIEQSFYRAYQNHEIEKVAMSIHDSVSQNGVGKKEETSLSPVKTGAKVPVDEDIILTAEFLLNSSFDLGSCIHLIPADSRPDSPQDIFPIPADTRPPTPLGNVETPSVAKVASSSSKVIKILKASLLGVASIVLGGDRAINDLIRNPTRQLTN